MRDRHRPQECDSIARLGTRMSVTPLAAGRLMMGPKHETDDLGQDLQNGTVRRGGEAVGGVAPQPGDPTSPGLADARAEERDEAQAERGFGDDGPRSTI